MKLPSRVRLGVIAIVIAAGSSAWGDPLVSVNVPNGSFENPASPGDNFTGTPGGPNTQTLVQDWTFNLNNQSKVGTQNYTADPTITGGTGNQGAFLSTYYGYYESDFISGNASNYSGSAGGAGNTGILAPLEPMTTYTLTLSIGVPTSQVDPTLSDAPGVVINLLDSNGGYLASNSFIYNNSQNVYYAGGIPYSHLSYGTFTDYTISFTTGATVASPFAMGDGIKAEVSLYNGDNGSSVGGIVIDNVRFQDSLPVPEPSTYAMMGLGLAGLVYLGRRKLA